MASRPMEFIPAILEAKHSNGRFGHYTVLQTGSSTTNYALSHARHHSPTFAATSRSNILIPSG